MTHQRHHSKGRGCLAVTVAVMAISALWPDHGGYPQMPIAGRGLGYAMSPGLQKGSDDLRIGISTQRGKDGVQAVTRVRPDDLHHLLARLTVVLEE